MNAITKNNAIRKFFTAITVLMLVLATASMVSACNADSDFAKITGIAYENGAVSWDKDAAVTSYKAFVDGVEQNVNTDGNSINIANAANDISVKILGYDEKEKVIVEIEVSLRKLPQLTVEIVDGKFDWSASVKATGLDNAETYGQVGYVMMINDEIQPVITDTSYAVGNEKQSFRVRPVLLNGTYSFSYYSEVVEAAVLATPSNVVFDSNVISWTPVAFVGATPTYEVELNGKSCPVSNASMIIDEALETELGLDMKEGLTIRVKAISPDTTIESSSFSEIKQYKALAVDGKDHAIVFRMEDGVLCWEYNDPDCVGYELNINNGESNPRVTEPRYTELIPGQQYNIRVRPLADADFTYSKWSDLYSVFLLNPPTIRNEDTMILWDSILNADGYRLVISKADVNGVKLPNAEPLVDVELPARQTYYNDQSFTEVGHYIVEVAVVTGKANYYGSKFSNPLEFVRLEAPKKYRVVDDLQPNGKLVIDFDEIMDATYALFFDGTMISSTSGSSSFSILKPDTYNERTYNISVQAIGLGDINDKYILSSIDTLNLSITKLGVPKNLVLDSDSAILSWNADPKAVAYGVAGWDYQRITETTFDMNNVGQGSFAMKVNSIAANHIAATVFNKAIDDVLYEGQEIDTTKEGGLNLIISGDYTSPVNITKLAPPTNISIEDGIVSWDSVDGNAGYEVIVNAESKGVFGSASFDLRASIDVAPSGSVMNVKALGNNGTDTIGSGQPYTLTSELSTAITYFRLDTPTDLKASNNALIWNRVNHATGYRVYIGGVLQATVQSTSVSIVDVPVGISDFTIQAIGNGVQYIDSVKSAVLSIRKLEQVSINRRGAEYYWPNVDGAVEYDISIGGRAYSIDVQDKNAGDEITFTPDFKKESNPKVIIRSMGDDGITSIASAPLEFYQETTTLSTPVSSLLLTAKEVRDEDKTYVKISTNVDYPLDITEDVNRYIFIIGGKYNFSKENTYLHEVQTSGSFDVRLAYSGNVFYEDVYYYNSEAAETTVTLGYLTAINAEDVEVQNEATVGSYSFQWQGVTNATYKVYYYVKGAEVTTEAVNVGTANKYTVNISEYSEYAVDGKLDVTVYIQCIGNGSTIVSNRTVTEQTFSLNPNA